MNDVGKFFQRMNETNNIDHEVDSCQYLHHSESTAVLEVN